MKKAINIDIPHNLSNKILLNTLSKNKKENYFSKFFNIKKTLTAVMASFGFIGVFFYMNIINGSIESKMMSEIAHHPEFMTADYNIELDHLNKHMNQYDIKFTKSIGKIRMLSNCHLKGEKGIHFIINGTYSPIIVHYYKNLETTNHSFLNENIKGQVINTTKGVFIIMSDKLNSQEKILNEINTFV